MIPAGARAPAEADALFDVEFGLSVGPVANQNPDRLYAVAVRDGVDLFLVLTIRRRAGNIYYNIPRDHDPDWKPHGSFHASGQRHHKSFDHKLGEAKQSQKPDANFKGTEQMVSFGVASDEPRKINMPCQNADYLKVFEIPSGELRPERYRTLVSVDIAEPGQTPIPFPGSRIIRQAVFDDSDPWILVTLFETPSKRAWQ